MRVTINLATRYYVDDRRATITVASIALVFGVVFAALVAAVVGNVGTIGKLKQSLGEVGREAGSRPAVPSAEYDTVIARIRFANDIIARKRRDWLDYLDRLEGVMTDGVALGTADLDPRGNTLKLNASALSFSDMRKFVEQLERSPDFTDVYLVGQRNAQYGKGQKGLDFTVTCRLANR